MYLVLIVFFGFVSILIAYFQKKTIVHPVIIFNGWWIVCTVIAAINPYGLYKVTQTAYTYIFWGMMFFDLACFIVTAFSRFEKNDITNPENLQNSFANIKVLMIIQIFLICVLLPYAIKAFGIFLSSGWMGIREINATGQFADAIFGSKVAVQLYRNVLIMPMAIATMILSCILFALGRMKIKQMLPTVILVVFEVFLTSGRMIVFRFVIYLVFAFLLVRLALKNSQSKEQKLKLYKKRRKIIIVVFAVVAVFAVNITAVRSLTRGHDPLSNFIMNMIIYLTGSLSYFSKILTNGSSFGLDAPLYHGTIFIGGIVDSFNTFCSYFLHTNPIPVYLATSYVDVNNYISSTIQYNAFPTIYYFFIRDFGNIGAMFEIMLFGAIASIIFTRFLRKKSLLSCAIYVIVLYLLIASVLWWELIRLEYWYCFIHLCWMTYLIKNKKPANHIRKYKFG